MRGGFHICHRQCIITVHFFPAVPRWCRRLYSLWICVSVVNRFVRGLQVSPISHRSPIVLLQEALRILRRLFCFRLCLAIISESLWTFTWWGQLVVYSHCVHARISVNDWFRLLADEREMWLAHSLMPLRIYTECDSLQVSPWEWQLVTLMSQIHLWSGLIVQGSFLPWSWLA